MERENIMKKFSSILLLVLVLAVSLALTACELYGKDGKDGITPTIEISDDGYWVINGEKTDVKATPEETVYENPQELQFYKQDDGTYIVSCGNAKYLSNIVIPATYKGGAVVEICMDAFSGCTSLKSITIPNSVTNIGANAFSSCTSLTSITISDSVTSIGANAFLGCTSLTDVHYTGNAEGWLEIDFEDSTSNPMLFATNLYFANELVTSVSASDSVTKFGDLAFYGCNSLTSVTIGESVWSIGDYTFACCVSLNSVTIGDFVKDIGIGAFRSCTSLTNLTIGNSVKSIGYVAFSDCTSLASITIPNSVTSIDSSAFDGCTSLESISFEGTVEQWRAISFGNDWNSNVPATIVVCTDGTVPLK